MKNRLFHALFGDLRHAENFAHNSFRDRRRFPVSSPCHPSLDCALNRQTRVESVPDSKSSRQKSGVLFKHLAPREWFLRAFHSTVSAKNKRRGAYFTDPEKVGFWISRASMRP